MNTLHREKSYEDELTAHLIEQGWLLGDAAKYDRARALYPDDVLDWVSETQPKQWQKIVDRQGSDAESRLLDQVVKQLQSHGTLWLLRNTFKDIDAQIQMCQFRPGHGLNPEVAALYHAVRCRAVRQVRYSQHNEKSIDVVLFVNGIPVATLELKTDFTQSIADAVQQYKQDRLPRDLASRADEPLLTFKRGALVHFAVSTDEVAMTTRLDGADTRFLPFNLGNDQGKGNPANPYGYRTAYLWEQILQRDAWLEILGRFVNLEKKDAEDDFGRKRTKEALIFPRFHQWRAVTKLTNAVRTEGPGHRYLIQHSAGSGKSNSIGWLAHALSSLHDAQDGKIFDSVIVVTDRTVLDKQLQDTIDQIDHKKGVVVAISDRQVKSAQLAQALVERSAIIVVTIQTFPFVLDLIQEQITLRERTFAVIADEAHSSQSGSTSAWLKRVLTAEQIEEGEEVSSEDVMTASMEARQQPKNASFFAFTATPKAKTLELFGRKPTPDGLPEPFDVYSMQQAIEEGFILDVLRNYIPYRVAYRLAHDGHDYDDKEIEQREGLKQLARWIRLHPHNIATKAEIIVEHFRENVAQLLGSEAKAMVVTASRKEAVRFAIAVRNYIQNQGLKYGVLVAFSGEVNDPDSGEAPFSEVNMNDLRGQDLREVFDKPEQRILIVANKYQTGFDQPKLVAMYVDKRLSGVNAVQTLSRLNRIYPGKAETVVVDFVNKADEILESFQPYYRTAQLEQVSDPNIIHDMQIKLDDSGIYTSSEVDAFARVYFNHKGKQEQLQQHLAPAVDRWRDRVTEAKDNKDRAAEDELLLFVKDMGSFVRAYDFLSQIYRYDDTDLEKRAAFFRLLAPLLKTDRRTNLLDLSEVELTHYRAQELGKRTLALKEENAAYLTGALTSLGSGQPIDPAMANLSEIVERMNSHFTGDNLTDADLVAYLNHVSGKMLENKRLEKQANNSKDQFKMGDFSGVFEDTVLDGLENYRSMAQQVLNNERTRKGFEALVLDMVYKGFRARRGVGTHE